MPAKNSIKNYIENGYYHLYNRGVEKRRIFQDNDDYYKFLHYLEVYLAPLEVLRSKDPLLRMNLAKNNMHEELELLAYCLMPNHFHLLVHQKTSDAIIRLMRQVTTAYSMYFNKKYERVGPLFQGRYKGCLVEKDDYLLHLSRYIHQNPSDRGFTLSDFQWSSYQYYVGKNPPLWLNTKPILEYFSNLPQKMNYESFVEQNKEYTQDIKATFLED